MTPEERVNKILAEAVGRDLSSWERYQFLPNIRDNFPTHISAKQEKILAEIEQRIQENHEDDYS